MEKLENMPEPVRIFTGQDHAELNNLVLTSEEITNRLLKLKPDKSPGIDNMHSRVLKEVAEVISEPLKRISNQCIHDKVVPKD